MPQSARSKRRTAKALAEGRIPGRPGPAKKRSEADQKAVIKERNAAFHAANREKIRQQKKAIYDLARSTGVPATDKPRRGRRFKYQSPEEFREADRAKTGRYRESHYEQTLAASREASKRRKIERAIAQGRAPGLVGNPKRFATEEERQVAIEAKRQRWMERKGVAAIRGLWIAARNRRRARKLEVGGTYTLEDVVALFEKQKGKCTFCLKPLKRGQFHIDHHQPLALGGSNDRSNLRLLHKKCNLSKGARDPAEHALRNGLLCW